MSKGKPATPRDSGIIDKRISVEELTDWSIIRGFLLVSIGSSRFIYKKINFKKINLKIYKTK